MDDPGYCVHCGSVKKPVDVDRSTKDQAHLTGECPDCGKVRWETVMRISGFLPPHGEVRGKPITGPIQFFESDP